MNRGPEAVHPSLFALEQLLAGQGEPQTTSHLLACDACRARLTQMEAAVKPFSASPRSLRARAAAETADGRWQRRAFAYTAIPVALLALIIGATLTTRKAPKNEALAQQPVVTPKLRQGREVLEPRPGTAVSPRLRSLSVRGRDVEFGQGSIEAATADGPARPFTLTHTKVDITVTGFMQAVTVTQTFHNPFKTPVEAVYVFPLPDDSAVHDMTLKAGARVIRAEVNKRAVARQLYEEAKAEGRRAALLDQERPNIFTQSLANLLPGEQVEVTLQYVAPLRYDDGVYTLNFPMVVGARYVPGAALPGENQGTGRTDDTAVVPDASRISPPEARSGRDIEVSVHLDSGSVIEDLWSDSHRLELDRPSSSKAELSLHPLDTLPNKDLIVRWSVSGERTRAAMLAGGGAFALMLNPEAKHANVTPTPKEMVFVIDTSGSMQGAPLAAAKRAMSLALEQMSADDTFMLIDFADQASSFHDAPLPATQDNVRRALAYLAALPSGGGTNQLAGIRRALARPEDPSRLRMVLLMTDGFIGNEEEILAETRSLRSKARVFGFGIGSSVNHFLLSRLSDEGRGFYQYLRPDQDAQVAVERFVRRVRRPLITDVTVDWGGLQVADVMPEPLADLFDAQPLIIKGRYRVAGTGTVVLRGKRGGEFVLFEVPVTFPPLSSDGRGLTMAWARERVEQLSRAQYNVERPEVVEQITALGLEFHLVTKYTSLVAVEATPVTGTATTTVVEPTLTPDQTTLADPTLADGRRVVLDGIGDGLLGAKGVGVGGGGVGIGTIGQNKNTERSPGTFGIDGDDDTFDKAFGGSGGDERLAPRQSAFVPATSGGGINGSGVLEVLVAHKAQLQACLERQKKIDPSLHGKLVLEWVIEENGAVSSMVVRSLEFANTEVARCIMRHARTWRFPPSSSKQTFVFPFKF